MVLRDRNEAATIRDHQADRCRRRACHHTSIRPQFRRTAHRPPWPATEAIRSTPTHQPAWISMARPVPVATVRPVQPKVATVPTGTVRARMEARQWLRRLTRPERNTTAASTITARLERMTAGISPVIRRTTVNRTAPRLTTVPFRQKPIPASRTMTDQEAMLVMTRKPTRKATQRPISTLMVVIIRRTRTKRQMK